MIDRTDVMSKSADEHVFKPCDPFHQRSEELGARKRQALGPISGNSLVTSFS